MSIRRLAVCFTLAALALGTLHLHAADEIDWDKARRIHQKAQSGQKLTAEEQAYYDKARAARSRAPGNGSGGNNAGGAGQLTPRASTGLVSLTDMTADQKYKGEDGGLYGHSKNTPPPEHLAKAMAAAKSIVPLDRDGKPSPSGRIVLVTHGMSNTTQASQASQAFIKQANADARKAANVVIVDGALGGVDALAWIGERGNRDPWAMFDDRLRTAGVTAAQVQVVWMKHAIAGPQSLGEFPKHAQVLRDDEAKIVGMLKQRLPNLKIIYSTSRTYAGWATSSLNPEPFAYESAFATRWLIQDQISGKNGDLAYGKAPVLLWGPYVWTDGEKGRKLDNLVWHKDDTRQDGTHPSESGQEKMGQMLVRFFTTDPTAKPWFTKPGTN
jgi:hypothetical protein